MSAHNLHKTYLLGVEGVPALRGVNLNIAPGEFIMILGTSGGGKVDTDTSAALHSLAALACVDSTLTRLLCVWLLCAGRRRC